MPRRAVFHKYPLIGRFADVARKRSYLWSFKSADIRPALYAGSVLAFMPAMGVQLPVAFLLALLLRTNVMVLGGLQFITNPVTAPGIYYGTYRLGKAVIDASGFGRSIEVVEPATPYQAPPGTPIAPPVPAPAGRAAEDPPTEIKWTRLLGTTFNALIIGGAIVGLLVGGVLDLLWRFGASRAAVHRAKVAARRARSLSTGATPPPK